jgi:UDP-N-acetylglucosamine 4,6-dehydratase
MFNGKTILLTGGTGSFGNTFTKMTLARFSPHKIIIYSRDEMKQWEMAKIYEKDQRLKFVIGDVRDQERLNRAMVGVDYVIHAAATKIVPTAEYNPFECIKTNIQGAMNVIEASINQGIEKVVALSTDKASSPISLYGATKLVSDKLFIASNSNAHEGKNPIFSVVRYGNVMGSRGSVIPFFIQRKKEGIIPITDIRMTRFMISLEQSTEMVWETFKDMLGGEIYIKKIPSMNLSNLAKIIAPDCKHKIIGIRPGEKLHEQMIANEDAANTYEYDSYYKILPQIHDWCKDKNRIKGGIKVPADFSYCSDKNNWWITEQDFKSWLIKNYNSLL